MLLSVLWPRLADSETGVSVVICRTKESDRFLRGLADQGRVRLVESSAADIIESQSRRLVYGDFSYAYLDYLAQVGVDKPHCEGPNRPEARPTPQRQVAQFHLENQRRARLMRQRRYRALWWRKLLTSAFRYGWSFLVKRLARLRAKHSSQLSAVDSELDLFR